MIDFIRICISLVLPPIGVVTQVGFGYQFWVCCLLTLFGYVPGLLYAIYVIVTVNDV